MIRGVGVRVGVGVGVGVGACKRLQGDVAMETSDSVVVMETSHSVLAIATGNSVVVVDVEDLREAVGDLVGAADHATHVT